MKSGRILAEGWLKEGGHGEMPPSRLVSRARDYCHYRQAMAMLAFTMKATLIT